MRGYRKTPKYKAYNKSYKKKLRQTPKYKSYMRMYSKTPQYKLWRKEYYQLPKVKATLKKYQQTDKYIAYKKMYEQTPEAKIRFKKYYQSPKGKSKIREYHQTPQYFAYQKKYGGSPQGKIVRRRIDSKRRNLGFTPIMNNPFPQEVKIDYHHINNTFVIPTPKKLHRKTLGKQHRMETNKSIENLGFELEIFIKNNNGAEQNGIPNV